MRFAYFLLFFVLLSNNAAASWQTYQNDLRNTGASSGTGYFPLKTANFSIDLGMNYQPLVDDLDSSGNNEIIIFSNNSLIVLNPQLEILKQVKVGMLLGQPTLFNFDNDNFVEIIFNARQSSKDYFFAYQYHNLGLQQEFNITLNNNAMFSGIKCLSLDGGNSCVFKDKINYVHVIDMNSKTDSAHRVPALYNESRETVPAIGDINDDGSFEAVFWLRSSDSTNYGIFAFDLSSKKAEWGVDSIFASFNSGFILKGQPVLADLNNDKKLEIAVSVFYDDANNRDNAVDRFTELFVYNGNGTKLFSKCETNKVLNVGCNDGDNQLNMWEGTNPFVMDYDINGIDDICFIKDIKSGSAFFYMGLNCYNYSGAEIAKMKLSDLPDGVKGTVMVADMNSDGSKELITMTDIYSLNGNSIFNHHFNALNPIAVDIDGNKGLDLLWTSGNKTKVFLDNYNYSIDLAVSDISFFKATENRVNVSATIKNIGQVEADNVKVVSFNTETLENNTAVLNIRKNGNATFNSVLQLNEGEKVLISVDYDNEINESDEENNFAFREFMGLPYVFVSSDEEPSTINSVYKDYIKNKLTSGYYTTNENEADIKVRIGKNNPMNKNNNINNLNKYQIGYDAGNIIYNDEIGSNPYSGLVLSLFDDDLFTNGKVTVMIVGNEIEGNIAGAKEFIRNQALLLNTRDKESIFVDDENADAVKVYDYLHLGGNVKNYGLNNNQFRTIVRNALNDEMFNVYDKNVVTSNGITLRLRNLKPNFSNDYLEYLNSTGMPVEMPVVLAHGIFSNLTTWEVLGSEISNTGRDTWLIEITGGPGQDCDDCIDYTFYNLTDIFVPALLNGVLDFTGKDKLQYVGFSNGCRAALDSLERNQFDSNKVETFVAVGCPGAFEGNSTLGNIILSRNGGISRKLESSGKNHHTFESVAIAGLFNRNYIPKGGSNKMSLNLWKFWERILNLSSDNQPGSIEVSNLVIIQGSALTSDDGLITVQDEQKIYQNANKNKNSKKLFDIFALHSNLDENYRTKSIIKKSLNKQGLNFYERTINLINESKFD